MGYLSDVESFAQEDQLEPDFRNQIKGRLLKGKVITQILRESDSHWL